MLIFWLGLFVGVVLPSQTLLQEISPQKNNTEGEIHPRSISEVTYDENGKAHVRRIPSEPQSGVFEKSTITPGENGGNVDQTGSIFLDENGQVHVRRFSSLPPYSGWFSSKKTEDSGGFAQNALIHRKVNIQSATLYRFKQKNTPQKVVQEILVKYPPVSHNFFYDSNNISCLFNTSDSDLVVLPPKLPQVVEIVPPRPPQVVEVNPPKLPQVFEMVPNDVRVVLPANTALLGGFPGIPYDNLPKRVQPFFQGGVVEVPTTPHFVGDDCEAIEEVHVPTNPHNIDRVSVSTPDLLWAQWNNLPKRVRPQGNPNGGVSSPTQHQSVVGNVQTPASTQILDGVSSPELLWPKWNGLPKNVPNQKNPLASSGYVDIPPQNVGGDVEIDVSSSSSSSYLTPASTKLLSNGVHHHQQGNTVPPQQNSNVIQNPTVGVPSSANLPATSQYKTPTSTVLLNPTNPHYLSLVDLQKLGQSWDNLPKRVNPNFSDQKVQGDVSYFGVLPKRVQVVGFGVLPTLGYAQTPASTGLLGGAYVHLQNFGGNAANEILPKNAQNTQNLGVSSNFSDGNGLLLKYGQTPASTQLLQNNHHTQNGFDEHSSDFVSSGYAQMPASTKLLGDGVHQLLLGNPVYHQKPLVATNQYQTPTSSVLLNSTSPQRVNPNFSDQKVQGDVSYFGVLPKKVQVDGSANFPASTGFLGGAFVYHQNFGGNAANEILPKNTQNTQNLGGSSSFADGNGVLLKYGQTPASTQLLQNNPHHQNGFVEHSSFVPGFAFKTANDFVSYGQAQMPASTKLLGDGVHQLLLGDPVYHQKPLVATYQDKTPTSTVLLNSTSPQRVNPNFGDQKVQGDVSYFGVLPKKVQVEGSANFPSLGYAQTPASTGLLGGAFVHHQNFGGNALNEVLPKNVQKPQNLGGSSNFADGNGVFLKYSQTPAYTQLLQNNPHHQNGFVEHSSFVPGSVFKTANDFVSYGYTQMPASTKLLGDGIHQLLGGNPVYLNKTLATTNQYQTPTSTVLLNSTSPQRVNPNFSNQKVQGDVSYFGVLPKKVQIDGSVNFPSLGYAQTPASTGLLSGAFVHHQNFDGNALNEVLPKNVQKPQNLEGSSIFADGNGAFLKSGQTPASTHQNNHHHQNGFVEHSTDFVSSGYSQMPASTNLLGGVPVHHQNFVVAPANHQNHYGQFSENAQLFQNVQPKRVHPWGLPKPYQALGGVSNNYFSSGYTQTPTSTTFLGGPHQHHQNFEGVPQQKVESFGNVQRPASTSVLSNPVFHPDGVQTIPEQNLPKRAKPFYIHREEVPEETPPPSQFFGQNHFERMGVASGLPNLPKRVQNLQPTQGVDFNVPASTQLLTGGISQQYQNGGVQLPSQTPVVSSENHQNHGVYVDFSSSSHLFPSTNDLPKRVNHEFPVENPTLVVGSIVQTPPSTQLLQNVPQKFKNRIAEINPNENSSKILYESQRVEEPRNVSGNPQNTLFESTVLPKNTAQQKNTNTIVEPPPGVVVENFAQIGVLKPTEENLPKRVQDVHDTTNSGGAEKSVPKEHSTEVQVTEVPPTVEPSPKPTLEENPPITPEIEEAFANFGKRITHVNKDSEETSMGDLVPNSHNIMKVVVYKKNPEAPENAHKFKVLKVKPLPKNHHKGTTVGDSNGGKFGGVAPSGTSRLVGDEIALPQPNEDLVVPPKVDQPHQNGATVSPAGTSPFTGILSGSFGRIPALRFSQFGESVGTSENLPKSVGVVPPPQNSDVREVQRHQKTDGDINQNGKTS